MATKLKVLLLAKVPRVGSQSDVIEVRKGFAMNYLIPQGLAKMATKHDISVMAEKQKMLDEKAAALKEKAAELKATIEKDASIEVAAKVSEKGKLYGSVSEAEVAEALSKKLGTEVPESQISMDTIKELGEHSATVKLADGVVANIQVHVHESKD